MQSIGITIELCQPRCLIHFRRWDLTVTEFDTVDTKDRVGVSQLRTTTITTKESHVLTKDSPAQAWCAERKIRPVILTLIKVDDYFKEWRTRTVHTHQLIVIPINERKLYWNVLRDLMVTLPRFLDEKQLSPSMGSCLMTWIGSEREARRFRVALASQISTSREFKAKVDEMMMLAIEKVRLQGRAEHLLDELCAFGAVDVLPKSRFDEGGEPDPEDDREEIYVPTGQRQLVDLEKRLRLVKVGAVNFKSLAAIRLLLEEFKAVFKDPAPGTVPGKLVEHAICFRQEKFISARAYRLGEAHLTTLKAHVTGLLQNRMIRPSSSPHSSAIFPIPKKDADGKTTEIRWVIDFRAINANTIPDRYPLPLIEELLSKVTNAKIFSKVDLKSAYWQVMVRKEDQVKTAFITPFGLYECVTMPFGLSNAPATFQRLIDRVLEGCTFAVGYLDDILVYSASIDQHVVHLREVFERLRRFGLCVSAAKCTLAVTEILFLGYVLTHGRLKASPSKVEAIRTFPVPTTMRGVQRFLGMVGFYRKFIRNFSVIASPLTHLTKKGVPYSWGREQQQAFETLRQCLTQGPILALPEKEGRFILETDASVKGLGGVLSQDFPEGRLPIAFGSRRLTGAETRYPTRELEALAILWCCKRFSTLLLGRPFLVLTDHASLEWLKTWRNPSPRVRRWLTQLEEFSFESRYRPGKDNKVADALSRPADAVLVAPVRVSVEPTVTDLMDFPEEVRWKQAYAEDPAYGPFLRYQQEGSRVSDVDRLRFERWGTKFHVAGDMLYLRRPGSIDPRGMLVIPEQFRTLFLTAYHDLPTAGHMGRDKMYGIMSKRFYWATMKTDIATYIRGCLSCALMRTRKPPKTAMALFDDVMTRPFEIIHVDHLTHMPKTPSGAESILVIADRCTGWIEAKSVRSLTAEETAAGIMEMVVCRHGVPGAIVSDNGGAFAAQLMAELSARCGFKQRFTTPYNPMSNGFVERRNGMIKKMLRSFCLTERAWDYYLGAILFALRTAPMERTGMTPAFLLYGRELVTPVEALLSNRVEAPVQDPTQWVISRVRVMKKAREMVASQLSHLREERVAQEQQLFGESEIVAGDHVLLHHPAASHEKLAKLLPYFSGPHLVCRKIGETTFEIEQDGKPAVVNVRRLLKCNAELVRRHVQRRPQPQVLRSASLTPLPPTSSSATSSSTMSSSSSSALSSSAAPTPSISPSTSTTLAAPSSTPAQQVTTPQRVRGAPEPSLVDHDTKAPQRVRGVSDHEPSPEGTEAAPQRVRGVPRDHRSSSGLAPSERERNPRDGEVSDEDGELKFTVTQSKAAAGAVSNGVDQDIDEIEKPNPKRSRTVVSKRHNLVSADKVTIGTFVLVQRGQESMLGKVTGRFEDRWIAHRWRARNRTAPGLKKRFFPAWENKGKIVITARPPRASSPVEFEFELDDVLYAGINLTHSMPDDAALDFANLNGLTVAVVSRPGGVSTRVVA